MVLHCPVCARRLTQLTIAGVDVDVCRAGCGGIWFDNFELQTFDEAHESAGEELLNVPFDPLVRVDHRKRRQCPKCKDMPMRRHFYTRFRQVEVDSCPNCGGYWLDCGELGKIRNAAKTAQELKRIAREYANAFVKPELARMRTAGREQAQQAGTLRRLFQFIGIR